MLPGRKFILDNLVEQTRNLRYKSKSCNLDNFIFFTHIFSDAPLPLIFFYIQWDCRAVSVVMAGPDIAFVSFLSGYVVALSLHGQT